ncbi:hypothetical protein CerSpe_116280 [Prunus speciosa]
MHPLFLLLLLYFFYSFEFTTSFPSNANLSNCSLAFDCGPLRNLSYPFTGRSRPAYCGPPEFHINCVNDSPELTILSLSYRVLHFDPVRRNLKLARSDLWTSTCTDKVFNSTMKSQFFAYNESDDMYVSIFYGCNSTNGMPKLANRFHCNNNRALNDSYYWIGPVPLDPIMSTFKCDFGITVPILKTTAAKLVANRSLFQEAIDEGFTVNYTNPYDNQCAQCLSVNGLCGFDSGSSRPVCICGNRVCDPAGSRKAIAIGVAVAVLLIIVIIFFTICISRKRILTFFKRHKRDEFGILAFLKRDKGDEFDVEAFIRNYGSLTPKRYTYANVKKMTDSFKDKIGKGGYGTVYKGRLPDGLLVAVKVLSESKGNGEDFINEVASIGRTSHVNIVILHGFCYERDKRALIYEFMPNGSLDNFIHKHGSDMENCCLEWKTLSEIAVGTARGLEYLHRGCNTRIPHFDIKPQNILLDKDFCPKISDFGLAKLCKMKESIVSMMGTRGTAGFYPTPFDS